MNEVAFVESREPDWQKLMHLCDKADASPTQLSSGELHELISLYRRVSNDLALVRTRSSNLHLIQFLNDLTGKAYGIIYRPVRGSFREGLAIGIASIAESARRLRWFVALSAVIFVLAGAFAYVLLDKVERVRPILISDETAQLMDHWKKGEFQERTLDESIMMTGFYSANNPRAAILTGGIAAGTFGVGSLYVLWENGKLLGILAHELVSVNRLGDMALVLPHGVTELSGFILAGAAGLHLGWALIAPGRRRRGDALRDAGKDGIVALSGAVLMMFLAAPVEGFISFNPAIPKSLKMVFALLVGIGWLVFWTTFGRGHTEATEKEQ